MNKIRTKLMDKLDNLCFDILIIVLPALIFFCLTNDSNAALKIFGLLFCAKFLYNILSVKNT